MLGTSQSAEEFQDYEYSLKSGWRYLLAFLLVILMVASVGATSVIDIAKFITRDAPILAQSYASLGGTLISIASYIIPASYFTNAVVIKGIQSLKHTAIFTTSNDEELCDKEKTRFQKFTGYIKNFVSVPSTEKEKIAQLKHELDGSAIITHPGKLAETEAEEFSKKFYSQGIFYKIGTGIYNLPIIGIKKSFAWILSHKKVVDFFYKKNKISTSDNPKPLQKQIDEDEKFNLDKKNNDCSKEIRSVLGKSKDLFFNLLIKKDGIGEWFNDSEFQRKILEDPNLEQNIHDIKVVFYINECIRLFDDAIRNNDEKKLNKFVAQYLELNSEENRKTLAKNLLETSSRENKNNEIYKLITSYIPSDLKYKPRYIISENDIPSNKLSVRYKIGDFFANFFTLSLTACCIYTAFGTGFVGIIALMSVPPVGAGILLALSLVGFIGMSWTPLVNFFHSLFGMERPEASQIRYLEKRKKNLIETKDLMQKRASDLSTASLIIESIGNEIVSKESQKKLIAVQAELEESRRSSTSPISATPSSPTTSSPITENQRRSLEIMSLADEYLPRLETFKELNTETQLLVKDTLIRISRAFLDGTIDDKIKNGVLSNGHKDITEETVSSLWTTPTNPSAAASSNENHTTIVKVINSCRSRSVSPAHQLEGRTSPHRVLSAGGVASSSAF